MYSCVCAAQKEMGRGVRIHINQVDAAESKRENGLVLLVCVSHPLSDSSEPRHHHQQHRAVKVFTG